MNILHSELWDSINRIAFPHNGFPAQNCGYALPEALKQCAVSMVRDGKPDDWYENPHQRIFDEQNVIDGLRELKHNGFLTFKDSEKENV